MRSRREKRERLRATFGSVFESRSVPRTFSARTAVALTTPVLRDCKSFMPSSLRSHYEISVILYEKSISHAENPPRPISDRCVWKQKTRQFGASPVPLQPPSPTLKLVQAANLGSQQERL